MAIINTVLCNSEFHSCCRVCCMLSKIEKHVFMFSKCCKTVCGWWMVTEVINKTSTAVPERTYMVALRAPYFPRLANTTGRCIALECKCAGTSIGVLLIIWVTMSFYFPRSVCIKNQNYICFFWCENLGYLWVTLL